MRGGFRIVGILSVTLLVCLLIGQAIWLFKLREIKREEFRQVVTFVLSEVTNEFLDSESFNLKYNFACCVESDKKTFRWGGGKTAQIASIEDFHKMFRIVFYDHLYQNNFLSLNKIDSVYEQRLEEKGVFDVPELILAEDSTGRTLMTTDSLCSFEGRIFTQPVKVGYECKHRLVAVFKEPLFFRSMFWHILWEGIFLAGFIICLVWQWKIMRITWQSARVQTLGVAHLEHELKKPLGTMISVVEGIAGRQNKELTDVQEQKLRMMKARLLKMADVTDTMLTALKTSELKIERTPVDIRKEMEVVIEMFRVLRPHAKVDFQVEEGVVEPLLDNVYFNCLMVNLVDNAIKYGGECPEVSLRFGKEGGSWVLSVTDNGIGMPGKDLKRIFRQFYRVKDKRVAEKPGFGLGLTFVKKVVDVYRGKIEVESELGRGSVFKIRIEEK